MPATQNRLDTRAQIVRAALDWVDETGLTRMSMGMLAKRARLARATLYQHFAGKEALVEAIVASELDKFYGRIHDYANAIDDNGDRLASGFGFAYAYLREHRSLQRVLAVSPGLLLPYIHGDSPQMKQGRRFFLDEVRRDEYREAADIEALADFIVRQLHSLLLSPLPHPDDSESDPGAAGPRAATIAQGRRYAERFVLPARANFAN